MNNLSLNAADVETVRKSLVADLQASGRFTEYDFNGSNMSALLDILAHNTYLNIMHNHLAINETFRSTANIRRNVVSRAEEINYVPRSFRSAVATIRVVIRSQKARGVIAIPKGTQFTTRADNRLFTFTTAERSVAQYVTKENNEYVFSADLIVYEGIISTDTFVFQPGQHFDLSNEQIDTTSLNVSVIEDGGRVVNSFQLARSVLDVNDQSNVYFLSTGPSGKYRLVFGDGATGRAPATGSTIVAEYRTSSGRLPNGAKVFKAGQAIDGEQDITVTTIYPATSGDIYETTDQIKFNASNSLRTQERGAGEQDYAVLLKRDNNDIIDVIATGGEKMSPPQYGKVFLSIASNLYTKLPESRKKALIAYLYKRSMMEPVIIDPDYLFLFVTTNVNFDSNSTNLTARDIQSFVQGQISQFASTSLGRFSSKFVRSKFVAAIDNAHPSITGNDTTVELMRLVGPSTIAAQGINTTFANEITSFSSSVFTYLNRTCRMIETDGEIDIVDVNSGEKATKFPIGTIDKATGELNILPTAIASNGDIKLIGRGNFATVNTPANTILKLRDEDVRVNIV